MKTYKEREERILQKTKTLKHRRRNKAIAITSVAAAAILTLNLVLFVPYQTGGFDLTAYKNSEYYAVMELLDPLVHDSAKTTNNFTEWFGDFTLPHGGVDNDDAPMAGGETATGTQTYEEVTNNQTSGVIEGDLMKRSDQYIYYLTEGADSATGKAIFLINAYSVEGENSSLVSQYQISADDNAQFLNGTDGAELYLSEDCSTLTLFTYVYASEKSLRYTCLVSLDVTNPARITETARVYLSGNYVSSRLTDDSFLVVTNFSAGGADFDDEATFLPQTGSLDSLTSLPMENIVLPDSATQAAYTVIYLLDEDTLSVTDSEAFLSYSDEVYVSSENLYVTRSYSVHEENVGSYNEIGYDATEIRRVSYSGDGLEVQSSVEVKGEINDRYSMDEYEGVLRVFTTCEEVHYYDYEVTSADGETVSRTTGDYYKGAYLFCVDLSSNEIIASVERFCPDGESVMSARFSGNTAYACTAKVYVEIDWASDPVYQFDLSDYNNITYTDTGTIPGYSLSLVTFTNDTLLGVGYGDSLSDLRIALYKESGSSVITVAEFELEDASFAENFKAYFIDADEGYIGLGVLYYDKEAKNNFNGYLLLQYDGGILRVVKAIELNSYDYSVMRADAIDGYFYLLTDRDGLVVISLG